MLRPVLPPLEKKKNRLSDMSGWLPRCPIFPPDMKEGKVTLLAYTLTRYLAGYTITTLAACVILLPVIPSSKLHLSQPCQNVEKRRSERGATLWPEELCIIRETRWMSVSYTRCQ
ncbi:hypothetical protein RvY_10280 [Ramazzottius varieornatus]|uniref:Uncharacterized protein n=1 Tax=Ramazzottius varieornatus TaxID=947166 RepID=A0A1D1VED0_RAMVA|nr:hypothetical protein RvY_10280 [Ramazzottius varieornatus]